jgi:hypothetical protein
MQRVENKGVLSAVSIKNPESAAVLRQRGVTTPNKLALVYSCSRPQPRPDAMSLRPQPDVQAVCAAMGQLRLPCQWGCPWPARCSPLGARPWQQAPTENDIDCTICLERLIPEEATKDSEKQDSGKNDSAEKKSEEVPEPKKRRVAALQGRRDLEEAFEELPPPEKRRVVELSCGHRFHMDKFCFIPHIAKTYIEAWDTGKEKLECPVCKQTIALVTDDGVEGTYENPSELEELMSSWARVGGFESPVEEYETLRSTILTELVAFNEGTVVPSEEEGLQVLRYEGAAQDFRDYLHVAVVKSLMLPTRNPFKEISNTLSEVTKVRSLFNDISIIRELVKAGVNSTSIEDYVEVNPLLNPLPPQQPLFLNCVPCSQWLLQTVQDTLEDLTKSRPFNTTVPAGVLAHTPSLQGNEDFVKFVIRKIPFGHRSNANYSMYRFSPYNTSVAAAFFFADTILVSKPEVHIPGLQRDGMALRFTPIEVRLSKEAALTAVRENGMALQYCASEYLSSSDVVTAAVRQNGLALLYASRSKRSDYNIILTAVKQNLYARHYADWESLRQNQPEKYEELQQAIDRIESGLQPVE